MILATLLLLLAASLITPSVFPWVGASLPLSLLGLLVSLLVAFAHA